MASTWPIRSREKSFEQRAVIEQMPPLHAQAVAGDLARDAVEQPIRQYAAARPGRWCRGRRFPAPAARRRRPGCATRSDGPTPRWPARRNRQAEHQGIHEASRAGHHRRPATQAPQHADAQPPANVLAHLQGELRGASHHDHRLARLPQPQGLGLASIMAGGFRLVEQGLVQGQIFRGGGERGCLGSA